MWVCYFDKNKYKKCGWGRKGKVFVFEFWFGDLEFNFDRGYFFCVFCVVIIDY